MPRVVGHDNRAVERITHDECAAVIEYVPNDVVLLWSGTDYGGGPDGAKGFKCPNCGKNVIIDRW